MPYLLNSLTYRRYHRIVQWKGTENDDFLRLIAGVVRAPLERFVGDEQVGLRKRREGTDVSSLLVKPRHQRGTTVTPEVVLENVDEGGQLRGWMCLELFGRAGAAEAGERLADRGRVDVETPRTKVKALIWQSKSRNH